MKTRGKKNALFPLFVFVSILYPLIFSPNAEQANATAQIPDFYYYYNEKVYLNVSTEMITICFKDTVTKQEKEVLISGDAVLKGMSDEGLPFGSTLTAVKEGLDRQAVIQAVERLNKLPEIKYSTPILEFRNLKLILTDEVVVRFKPDITEQDIQALNEENGVVVVSRSPYRHNRYILRVMNPKDKSALEAANIYNQKSQVEYATPNFLVIGGYCSTYPDDTYFQQQWALDNTGQEPPGGTPDADMDAPEGWDISTGSSDIVIAIIDGGVDIDHPDLAAKIWVNAAELNGTAWVDDDRNGYVDDIHGWDFANGDNDPRGTNAHGTACAGLAAAETNNETGIAGVSWGAKIMPLHIGTSVPITSAAADAIDYACANGADVLSTSFSISPNADVTDAIINAKNNGRDGKGCVIVCASGNTGENVAYPASLDEVIAVGATNEDDAVWYYSNNGDELDVVAPSGEMNLQGNIWTTDIAGEAGYNNRDPNILDYTDKMGGTSAAAPQVAGLAALLLSNRSYLTSDEVQNIIQESADNIGAAGWDQYSGWGRINIYNTVKDYPLLVILSKTDDVTGCIEPNSFINYQICWSAIRDVNNVNIIDELPQQDAEFEDANDNWDYNEVARTVTWNLGDLEVNESGCVSLRVKVLGTAGGGSTLTNTVKMYSDSTLIAAATEHTKVCCLEPVVYVDKDASGDNNGTSWANAYKELRNALINVRDGNCGCAENIWVAAGTYAPTEANDTNPSGKTFTMLDWKDVYGHFDGNETSIDQRRLADTSFDTILTGDIDGNNISDVQYVVTAADSRIDGFTVKKASNYGITCGNCSPTIENCVIKNNGGVGIFCASGSNVAVANTFINNNGSSGIFSNDSSVHINIDKCTVGPNNVLYGLYISSCAEANATDSTFNGNSGGGILATNGYNLFVERCDISNNKSGTGITCGSGDIANIRRCTIQRNSDDGLLIGSGSNVHVQASLNVISNNNSSGVSISESDTGNNRLVSNFIYGNKFYGVEVCNNNTAIINNTIVNNNPYGICGYDDSNITSNIIWGNGDGSFDGSFGKVNYNCVQGGYPGINNINLNPQFRDPCDNDYHLLGTSPCIDTGDPNFADSIATDIDGQRRILDGDNNSIARVDMGADEFGIVNFLDFAVFAESWKTSQGQTAYNNLCDFYKDNKIDFKDLYIFADNWLSIPDWFVSGGEGAYFADSSIGGEMETMMSEPESMPALSEAEGLMSMASEQLLLMAGEGETAAIYLVSDVNEPNSGDEVTIQVYSDVPLFAMGLGITVTGDANITSAMSTADCNQFGWDPSWPTDPLIDPTGWVYISGVKWEADVDGVVGYIKFRYNSGQVSVSITEGDAFDADCGPVLISSGALTFGADPNES